MKTQSVSEVNVPKPCLSARNLHGVGFQVICLLCAHVLGEDSSFINMSCGRNVNNKMTSIASVIVGNLSPFILRTLGTIWK